MAQKTALIVVDMQEDFCPPARDGALAVPDGRAVLPALHALLAQPFTLKIATKDWHPADHVSFAANHAGAAPFASTTVIANPLNAAETYATRLWPVHCVQGSRGAALVRELAAARWDAVVEKGTDARVEMYSAFRSPLRAPPLPSAVSGLERVLRDAEIAAVVVGGLAGDYCVLSTALDARELAWETFVVEEATRCVGGDAGWADAKKQLEDAGVKVVGLEWVKENLF
ncbi:isochorismatase hydrolase [Phanerochaete sordida]|uniref:nicotinamidase n=1 Tax=Phanerochaete sordida TaxID=48140 RepID=A0A9P3L6U7_9APHY|nr:isochorismatase hydrolase [Phanerochaete sordida]